MVTDWSFQAMLCTSFVILINCVLAIPTRVLFYQLAKIYCNGFAVYPLPEQGSYAVYSSQLAKCILKKSMVIGTSKGTTVFQSFEYLNDYSVVLIPFIQK